STGAGSAAIGSVAQPGVLHPAGPGSGCLTGPVVDRPARRAAAAMRALQIDGPRLTRDVVLVASRHVAAKQLPHGGARSPSFRTGRGLASRLIVDSRVIVGKPDVLPALEHREPGERRKAGHIPGRAAPDECGTSGGAE